ncbi:MAG: hypothetical protein JXO51_08585 [Candidatus Aminicenantes bacterium]|nr:hypothetical protein [Candidatus Aminicenantes bacterium]
MTFKRVARICKDFRCAVTVLCLAGICLVAAGCDPAPPAAAGEAAAPPGGVLAERWAAFSGNRPAKVVYARAPRLFCLDLASGAEREVPGVEVAGAPGRRLRGGSPRPSWAPDGGRFAYRFAGRVYVCDEDGRRRAIIHPRMDCSDETRWSWHRRDGSDWLAGPSVEGQVILVKVSDPAVVRTAFAGGRVAKHCEITGSGRFVVYDDGVGIFVALFGATERGRRISRGQSCRPCAAADDRAAWLPSPHDRYCIFDAADGRFLGDLMAPPGEKIYRLNWSNLPDFAVHMDDTRTDARMHARRIATGESLFLGSGWDPDLWVSPSPRAR